MVTGFGKMKTLTYLLAVCIVCVSSLSRFDDFSDIMGPYCSNSGCCNGRRDLCAAPILGTLCYCDDFCDQNRVHDCCPDYWSFCLNETLPTTTTTTRKPITAEPATACTDENRNTIFLHRKVKKNCNLCTCTPIDDRRAELLCETDECIVDPNLTSNINRLSNTLGWSASNYSEFWGHKLDEGIEKRLGTLQPHRIVKRMNALMLTYDPTSLPRQFDAEEEWPGKISRVQDQGWCGSSWAISTAAVASDRYAIMSEGLEDVQLSAQHLLSCDLKGQQSCKGGHLDRAWIFVIKHGLVDEECFPYTGRQDMCTIPQYGSLKESGCVPIRSERTSRYRVSPAYRLGNETDIMFEIMKSGPVQATIKVEQDFFVYQSGIYRHSDLPLSHKSGYHSVRIVGWGEEYTSRGLEKYWKVANSWGQQWGENGYFRILRGNDECEIESFVLGTWPEIEKHYNIKESGLRHLRYY